MGRFIFTKHQITTARNLRNFQFIFLSPRPGARASVALETTPEQTAKFVHSCDRPAKGGVTLCILYILNFYLTALEGVSREWKAIFWEQGGFNGPVR